MWSRLNSNSTPGDDRRRFERPRTYPIAPPAPGRLTTSTLVLSCFVMPSASTRAVTSAEVPREKHRHFDRLDRRENLLARPACTALSVRQVRQQPRVPRAKLAIAVNGHVLSTLCSAATRSGFQLRASKPLLWTLTTTLIASSMRSRAYLDRRRHLRERKRMRVNELGIETLLRHERRARWVALLPSPRMPNR